MAWPRIAGKTWRMCCVRRELLRTSLFTAFHSLLRPFSVPAHQVEQVFADLVARYGENGRFYHNLQHIEHTLAVATSLRAWAQDFTAVQLALWFHDVVYEPRHQDNEAQSAVYARQVLTDWGVAEQMVSAVSHLILLTQHHQTAETDADGQVVLDADLSILAADAENYRRYAQAIRQEYHFVPTAAYRQGRTAVLQRFLSRPRLFYTPPMQSLTHRAHQNLHWEIEKIHHEWDG